MNKKLLIVFILAFLVRLIALNQSLWLDEATTAKVVQHFEFLEIIRKFSPNDFHPPLYYLFIKLWTNLFGYSEIALRFPSVIFSLLAGVVLYKIAGIWAAVLFLFNPLIIYYSQEARMYMQATFLLTASLYYFIRLCKSGSRNKFGMTKLSDLLLFNLFNILSFVTFYGSVFLIASFLLYFLYKKQYRLFFLSLIFHLSSFIILSPLLFQQFIHAKQSLQIVINWSLVLGKASLKNLLLIPLKFSIGRISFEPKMIYYLISGIWTAFIFYFTANSGLKNKLFGYLFIFPLVIGFIFSFVSPLLQYFRFLYLTPILSILLARNTIIHRYAVVTGFLVFSLIYLSFPQFHREDWKLLVSVLKNTNSVYMILPSSDPVKYYNSSLTIKELRTLEGVELEKQITVIPYTTDIYGFDYKRELMKKGFVYKERKDFRGVWYEIWVRNKVYAGSLRYSLITART
jgi:uncharacterized membrane protein